MSKYRLTTLFVIISIITLGTAAFAINHLAIRTAEKNLVEFATDQSMRDASIIAGLVNQLLEDQGNLSSNEPARLASTVPIESQKLLDSLRVIDISLYDSKGQTIWSTSAGLIAKRSVPQSILASTADGQLASHLSSIEILADPESPQHADVVETFLPLLDANDGIVVCVEKRKEGFNNIGMLRRFGIRQNFYAV